MPFKETKEGQTHSFNDGCGELEHNINFQKQFKNNFDKDFDEIYGNLSGIQPFSLDIKSFFHSQISKLLEEVKKCLPEEGIKWMQEGNDKNKKGFTEGFNFCRDKMFENLEELSIQPKGE